MALLAKMDEVNAAEVLTPSQMKSQLTEQDTKEATPIGKTDQTNTSDKDDVGMPIDSKAKSQQSNELRSIYPDVNSYILKNNFQHPDVTQELHAFSMFNYKTSDKKPTGVVIHYTDNPNNYSARNEANYEINGGWQSAFVHTFIDAGTILNIHNTDFGAWGCGPVGNKYFTQFEMVTARNFNDFAKTTSYSAWYTAYLLKKYNLTPTLAQAHNGVGTIWTHHDVTQYLGGTDHTDPDAYFAKYGYSTSQFFGLVMHYYNQMKVNIGDLNSATISNNNLHVRGWHVSSDSKNRQFSYLFLMDANNGRELKRYKIDRKNRTDVNNAYPNVINSLISGFDANLTLTPDLYGKKVKVMSRYSSDSAGNANSVDYQFKKVISIPELTAASLDNFSIKGNSIQIRGWHASSFSSKARNSYLILTDSKGNEYKRYKISRLQRPDVAKTYPNIPNSGMSGFKLTIPITRTMSGKTFKVISRYATQVDGEGLVNDWRFNKQITLPKVANENKFSMDQGWMDNNQIHIAGWHAIDDIVAKPFHTLIFMDTITNKELYRTSINNKKRVDVQKAYPEIANSLNSGFNVDVKLNNKLRNKSIYVISRYSANRNANKDYLDVRLSRDIHPIRMNNSATNLAILDKFKQSNNILNLKGWHATNAAKGKKYHYLILMDRNTNSETGRVMVSNTARPDVKKAYSNIYKAENSGFVKSITLNNVSKGKYLYVISRYTSDRKGNRNYIDYIFGQTVLTK
ncbi:KxYKxGKxW signal domain protein [Latilactobacillus graminis DSM 20719]|uniref:KxYKxGKxW signal domain protein n=1 Tax=Latilactobacillus graminis DSM 20719 TaxID=1423752 RepID=A0AA89L4D8_9LACO|nr:KxYKxGKxW signal domain protein [Latilactobacillus graminis DSM 20719]